MKRGFTLIELMAVIVVLGIIATISVISVDKVIKENKEETYKAQIATIEDAARTWGVKHIKELPDNEGEAISVPLLYLKNEGIISKDLKNPKTNKPFNDDLYVNISYEGGIYKYEVAGSSGLGTITNPTLLNRKYSAPFKTLCKAVTTATTGNVPSGNLDYGDEYICDLGDTDDSKNLTFFVLDKTDTEVSLIMNQNLGSTIQWISKEDYVAAGGTETDYGSYGNNNKGPLTAMKTLKERTLTWTKLDKDQITLPTANQIATASGKTFSNTPGAGSVSGLSTWLYDYLDAGVSNTTLYWGYWTSSTYVYVYAQETVSYDYSYAWSVTHNILENAGVRNTGNYGIRPVITLPIE